MRTQHIKTPMRRLEIVLVAILLLPVIVAGGALLMRLPVGEQFFYLSLGWVVGWLACYLAARAVAWVIAKFAADGPQSN
jgi:hypothetical protein